MRKYDYTLRDKAENEWRNFEIETNNEAIILVLASIEVIYSNYRLSPCQEFSNVDHERIQLNKRNFSARYLRII